MSVHNHWHIVDISDGGEMSIIETDAFTLDRTTDEHLERYLDGLSAIIVGDMRDVNVQWIDHPAGAHEPALRLVLQHNRAVMVQEVKGCYDRRCRYTWAPYWIGIED